MTFSGFLKIFNDFLLSFFIRIAKIAAVVELPNLFFGGERERVFLTGGEKEREERRERER